MLIDNRMEHVYVDDSRVITAKVMSEVKDQAPGDSTVDDPLQWHLVVLSAVGPLTEQRSVYELDSKEQGQRLIRELDERRAQHAD